MRPEAVARPADAAKLGVEMYRLVEELFPICRSITGNGVRQTLAAIARHVPLEIIEVASGTPVFDWTVPKEWNIRDAYIENAHGDRIVDFRRSNLHVLNYSTPVDRRMTLAELRAHLFTLPEHPDWIPYRTSYYKENWGFCLSHNQLTALEEGEYHVVIDSTLAPGHLTYGELLLQGTSADEVLISCHVCHPSLCNDNLSGIALSTFLARALAQRAKRRYSYRFLFIPGTIGSITWLAQNEAHVDRIKHGLVVNCVGDNGRFTYKRSRRGNADIDHVVEHVLGHCGAAHQVIDFYPYGYDERQYCSPGFNLPVGSLSRSTHGQYPEYHTSADNLDLVRPEYLAASLDIYCSVIEILEHNRRYRGLNPKCEPQLGKRGLFGMVGANRGQKPNEMALLWVLNMSDGTHSLLDIANRAQMPFSEVHQAAQALISCKLLQEC